MLELIRSLDNFVKYLIFFSVSGWILLADIVQLEIVKLSKRYWIYSAKDNRVADHTKFLTVKPNGPKIVCIPTEDVIQTERSERPRQTEETNSKVALSVVNVCDVKWLEIPENFKYLCLLWRLQIPETTECVDFVWAVSHFKLQLRKTGAGCHLHILVESEAGSRDLSQILQDVLIKVREFLPAAETDDARGSPDELRQHWSRDVRPVDIKVLDLL